MEEEILLDAGSLEYLQVFLNKNKKEKEKEEKREKYSQKRNKESDHFFFFFFDQTTFSATNHQPCVHLMARSTTYFESHIQYNKRTYAGTTHGTWSGDESTQACAVL